MNSGLYTRFPHLLSLKPDNAILQPCSHPLPTLQGTKDDLVLAWARLLSKYSGDDEIVSFILDHERVEVNVLQRTITSKPRRSNEDVAHSATGIFFAPTLEPFKLAIELHFDADEVINPIGSNGLVPSEHLTQIALLLEEEVKAQSSKNIHNEASTRQEISLSALNENPCLIPGPEILHDLINFDGNKSDVAIEYFDHDLAKTSITFEALNQESARLATKIRDSARRSGLRKGGPIPVLIPQSPALYVSLLAILRAGFAFCPLQLDAPPDRVRFILKDVGASVAITVSSQVSRLSVIPDLAIVEADSPYHSEHDLLCDDGSDNSQQAGVSTAYIMYTSGSTGQPKGVSVSHRSVTQSLLAHDQHIPKYTRFLQFAASTFDVSVFEIFFTLFRGSTLVACERTRLLNDLPTAMVQMRIDAAELTPTVAGGLLQRRESAPSLKLLLTIGEMLTPQVVKEFGGSDSQPSILWGMYGPTEAAIHCTLQPAFSAAHRTNNIGFPLETTSAFVVSINSARSEAQSTVDVLPLGHVGELAIGGFQLADGYLNREVQTAEAFIYTKEYGILYRTGDKARMLLDGTIECLGRISSGQVKLRGQRIEIGEVRFAVSQTRGCRDATVSIINGSLVAFCVINEEATVDSILATCREWLPAFMVPSDVVLLPGVPQLPSGKVDTKKLEHSYASQRSFAPSMEAQSIGEGSDDARAIIEKVLGRKLDVNARLSASGLDSLIAIRVASLLRMAGFTSVSPIDLLIDQTAQEFLSRLKPVEPQKLQEEREKSPLASDIALHEIRLLAVGHGCLAGLTDTISAFLPCTPLQIGMLAETAKDPTAYCNLVELALDAPFDYNEVVRWLQCLAQSNAMLRAGFCQLNSRSYPYACIIWKTLQDDQIMEATDFNRNYRMTEKELLRPINFQVCCVNKSTRILMQIHHAQYDGWSVDLLRRDLSKLSRGETLAIAPEFSHVSKYYQDINITSSLEYWQERLSGYTASPLPNFNGRKSKKSDIRTKTHTCSTRLAEVQQAADAIGCTKQVLFQAATAYILSGYLGNPDVLMGMITSGRSIPVAQIEDIVGPCLAACPLRINVSHSRTVSDLLRNIQELNGKLVQHANVSVDSIRRACDIDISRPLWDVLFIWQESLESRIGRDHNVKVVASADRLECALTLEFEPAGGMVTSRATFHNNRFSKAQATSFLQQIDSLVITFAQSAEQMLKAVEESLPRDMLSISNPHPESFAFEYGLEHGVEEHAMITGDALAVVFASAIKDNLAHVSTLTYRELNTRANQLAHFLISQNLQSQELICICMEKSLDLYVAILAVLKLGCGYLPITPVTPRDRIKLIIEEAGVKLCLSQASVSSLLYLDDICNIVNVDNTNFSAYPGSNLKIEFDGSRAAYAMFTSGSTGVPKGIVVTQQNLLSNLTCVAQIYPVESGDRFLQACSQAFDVSVFEIFFSWQLGMCLCSATNDVLFQDIEASIRALEVTHLSLTPTVAALVNPENVSNVKFLVTAGEGVTEKVKKAWSGRGLYQGYGPSETTNICSVKPDVHTEDLIENIGPPLNNTSAFVFDPEIDTILPMGAVGELCFGGDQVFRGYMNRPELTASKIIQHPTYGRLYRSGDTGRIIHDGSILFAGRLDGQVKIRGQRVELNEINHRVLECYGIEDCATILVDNLGSPINLVTFWIPAIDGIKTSNFAVISLVTDGMRKVIEYVYQYLCDNLPSYMIPVMLVPITKIPTTAQGKTDHRMLLLEYGKMPPGLGETLGRNDADGLHEVDDWTANEKIIVDALSRTLERPLDNVRWRTSFFNFGLDSISAIAFARYLRNTLDREVSVSQILRNPSVGQLAQALAVPQDALSKSSSIVEDLLKADTLDYARDVVEKAGIEYQDILPCTPLQEAMLTTTSRNASLYCNTMLFKVQGSLDRLEECWKRVCSRHAALRTIFINTPYPSSPCLQVVLAGFGPGWERVQTASLLALREIPNTLPDALNSFKPPFVLRVISCGEENFLQFSCHHALADGTAIGILLEEIEKMFKGQDLPVPVDPTPFLAEVIAHNTIEHEEYWLNELADHKPTLLNVDGHAQESSTKLVSRSYTSLEQDCLELGSSILSLSQLAWAKTQAALFGTSDICFGNVVSGRTVPVDGVERLVTPTFNTIPFRTSLARHRTNLDLLKGCQRMNTASLNHQLTPLRAIQSKLGYGGSGLFSTLLLLQYSTLSLDPKIWTLEHERGIMDFPLIIELIPSRTDDTLRSILYYNTSIINQHESEEILRVFQESMETCVRYPNASGLQYPEVALQTLQSVQKNITRPISAKLTSSTIQNLDDLTPPQSQLFRIIADFTGVPFSALSLNTTIYQIGVDSITAIQLAAKLRAENDIDITAAELIERPTIRDIAVSIEGKRGVEFHRRGFDFQAFHDTHLPIIHIQNDVLGNRVERVSPCTPTQNGLISQFLRTGTLYVNHVTYALGKEFEITELEQAWEKAVEDIAMLRTGFAALEDHATFPFAMVTQRADGLTIPVRIISRNETFDVAIEREEYTRKFHNDLLNPCWAAVLQDTQNGLLMHLSMFHGIYDATSLELILLQLSQSGNKSKRNIPTFEPVLSDIIIGADANIGADEFAEDSHATYWKCSLRDASFNTFPDLTPLRVSTNRILVVSNIASITMSALEKSCQLKGFTLQAAGQVAWARLLAAYMGEPNVTFGVVLSGRDVTARAENVIFPCLTTVPFAVTVSGRTNVEIIKAAMSFNSAVRKHQFSRMADIQRWAGREVSFDTIFALQKTSCNGETVPFKVVEEISSAEYAISLELESTYGNNLLVRATFKENLIPERQAEIMIEQFCSLLTNVIEVPNGEGTAYSFGSDKSFMESVTLAKETVIPSPVKLLHEFVELHAKANPDKVAFEFCTRLKNGSLCAQRLTYKELDMEGNRIANLLQKRGIEPGSFVGICFEKCPEASFGILGILKAGCAYVAIDPTSPTARKAFIVEDSNAKVILTTERTARRFNGAAIAAPIVYLDEILAENFPTTSPKLLWPLQPDAVCYCLYTSGTTGSPKGCEITHENAVQAMRAFSRLFFGRWNEDSRWLQFASFHFDVSVLEQYWSWSEGICVVSAPRDMIFENIEDTIRDLKITHIDLTPSLALLVRPENVPSLCKGVFITGGEQLKQEILDVWGPEEVIHNGYGPTEATIGVTMFTRVPKNGKPANIGRQFDNVSTYVLHSDSNIPVLRGGIGELCIGGKLVGKGYLNRPELTAQKFPYVEAFGERIYRTGDLVRILHDNSFLFLGRGDDQVKLRGQRLEIGEINTIIRKAVSGIQDVATYVLRHPMQQRDQLVTFFVSQGAPNTSHEVEVVRSAEALADLELARESCVMGLPGYSVPTHFIPVNRMPLSTNNKTDPKVLKNLFVEMSMADLQALSSSSISDSRMSDLEMKVVRILAEFTKIEFESLGPSANFLELGLDSISVIPFSSKLKKVGLLSATPALVMTNPTTRSLLTALSKKENAKDGERSILAAQQSIFAFAHQHRARVLRTLRVANDDIESIVPCTPLQEGMILKALEGNHNQLYFSSFNFTLQHDVDALKLRSAWQRACDKLQVLRTRFVQTNDGMAQVVLWHCTLPIDIAESQESSHDSELERRRATWAAKNHTYFSQPVELILWNKSESRIMTLNIFHALHDGQSLLLLLSLVRHLYMGTKEIGIGPTFHSALPYGPLRINRDTDQFWARHIKNRIPASLHTDFRPTTTTRTMANVQNHLDNCRKRLNVTHQALIQAAWMATLYPLFKDVLSTGLVCSGRAIDFEGAERVIGPLFNTIPFHVSVDADDTWKSLIQTCHNFNVEALQYQHTPLRQIRKIARLGRDDKLFETLFVFQIENATSSKGLDNELWTVRGDQSTSEYPLALEAELKLDNSLCLTLATHGQSVNGKAVEDILERFETCLTEIIQRSEGIILRSLKVSHRKLQESAHSPKDTQSSLLTNDLQKTAFEWTKEALVMRAEIARLSGIDREAVDPNMLIFELGLDSIDAIRLSSRLSAVGLKIPVSAIMQNPSISSMATWLDQEDHIVRPAAELLPEVEAQLRNYLQREGVDLSFVERVLPSTPLQEAMFSEMIASEHSRYFNHDILKLSSDTDVSKLKDAWQKVFESSPILRTSFHPINDPSLNGSYAQFVTRDTSCPWNEMQIPSDQKMQDVLNNIRYESSREDVEKIGFKLTLTKWHSDLYLILSLPHALYDAWVLQWLHSDVAYAYFHGQIQTRPQPDSVLEDILSAVTPSANTFWSDFLSEARPCLLSGNSGQAPSSKDNIVYRRESTSDISAETLRRFCKRQGITLQTFGQACYSLVLASLAHRLDLVYGIVLSGRDTEDAQNVLFPTMNTVAFHIILHGNKATLLKQIQDTMSSIRNYQHFPLRKAQSYAKPEGQRLFDSLFIYQSKPSDRPISEQRLYESIGGQSDLEIPICVEMEVVGEKIVWRAACHDYVLDLDGTEDLHKRLELAAQHLLVDVNEEVLLLDGGKVTMGSLPTFNIADLPEVLHHSNQVHELTRKVLPPIGATIRSVLSQVSLVPEDEIEAEATLYHLGLDSISAIKVSALLKQQGMSISVSNLLRSSTLRGIATFASENHDVEPSVVTSPGENAASSSVLVQAEAAFRDLKLDNKSLSRDFFEVVLPATAGQVYMLNAWQNSRGRLFFDEFTFTMTGEASPGSFRSALTKMVTKHPILRTFFASTGTIDKPVVQLVAAVNRIGVEEVSSEKQADGTSHDRGTCRLRPLFHGLENSQQPFVMVSCSEIAENTWKIGLRIHHALYDGISLPRLLSDLRDAIKEPRVELSSTSSSATDFANFIQDSLATENAASAQKFWKSYLGSESDLLVTTESQGHEPDVQRSRSSKYKPALVPDAQGLIRVGRQHGLTLPSIFLAVYARLYKAYNIGACTASERVVIGLYIANRSHGFTGLETFPTVNLLPVCVDTSLDILASSSRVQEDIKTISELANVSVGLWEIYNWTGVRVDTFVNWIRTPESEDGTEDDPFLSATAKKEMDEVVENQTSEFEAPEGLQLENISEAYPATLDVEVALREGALDVGIFGPTAVVDPAVVDDLLKALKDELSKVMDLG